MSLRPRNIFIECKSANAPSVIDSIKAYTEEKNGSMNLYYINETNVSYRKENSSKKKKGTTYKVNCLMMCAPEIEDDFDNYILGIKKDEERIVYSIRVNEKIKKL